MAVGVVAATRRRFTRAEYYRMVEVGILGLNDRVELIRGEIVQKMPGGRRHRAFVDNLTQLLVARIRDRAIVSMICDALRGNRARSSPNGGNRTVMAGCSLKTAACRMSSATAPEG